LAAAEIFLAGSKERKAQTPGKEDYGKNFAPSVNRNREIAGS
jgi:hypothetical protein